MSGNLDHRPTKIIKKYLLDRTLGTEVSADDEWPIFVDHMGDNVEDQSADEDVDDNAICVHGPGGVIHGRTQVDGENKEDHGIQIKVRAETQSVGWAKAKAIQEDLDKQVKRTSVSINSSVYMIHSMNRTSDVLSLGPEPETRRRIFTINYLATITQTS